MQCTKVMGVPTMITKPNLFMALCVSCSTSLSDISSQRSLSVNAAYAQVFYKICCIFQCFFLLTIIICVFISALSRTYCSVLLGVGVPSGLKGCRRASLN